MANLFSSQTPSSADENAGGPLTVATTLYFTEAGTVTGGRFFAPLTVGAGTFTLKLWSVDTADPGTGTLLASKTLGTPTAGIWNSAVFDNPVTITANTVAYRIGVGMSAGRYTVSSGFFGVSLTNGSIVAPENGGSPTGISVRNGTYAESETGFPVDQFNSSNYFVDVDFTAGSSPTPIAVADAGSAVSSLLAGASAPVSDAGSAADAVAAAVALSFGDTAAAADVAAIIAAAGLADGGTSDQALTVAVAAALADAGLAVDLGDGEDDSNVQKSLADIGSAIERLRTTTVRPNTGTTVRPFTGITLRP